MISEAKEHRYTKVTARESLASMTARNALNTYETVPDLPENTYATVRFTFIFELDTCILPHIRLINLISKQFTHNQSYTSDKLSTWVE